MTLHDLLTHHREQLAAVQAYFNTDDTDGKTAKKYRQRIAVSQARVNLIEKTIDTMERLQTESAPTQTTGEMECLKH